MTARLTPLIGSSCRARRRRLTASFQLRRVCWELIFALSLLLTAAPCGGAISQDIQAVALTGTDGAKGPQLGADATYTSFSYLAVNAHGQIAFAADVIGGDVSQDDARGVWLAGSGAVAAVARTGTDGALGPGQGSGMSFMPSSFYGLTLNDSGSIAFSASTSTLESGNWLHTGGANVVAAMTGTDGAFGPHLGSGVQFAPTMHAGVLTNHGAIVFSHLVNQNDPVAGGQRGIWQADASGPVPIARANTSGVLGPRRGDASVFTAFEQIVVAPGGRITVNARLSNPEASFTGSGIFDLAPSGNAMLALTGTDGTLGPQLGGGVTFRSYRYFKATGDADLTAVGVVQGVDVGSGNAEGVWRIAPGAIVPLARSGTDGSAGPQLGPGIVFTPYSTFAHGYAFGNFSGNGKLTAFQAFISGGGYSLGTSGIWVHSASGLRPIVLTGAEGEGGYPGFSGLWLAAVNHDDSVLFMGRTQADARDGFWTCGRAGVLPVIQQGDVLSLGDSPSLVRTVATFGAMAFDTHNARLAVDVGFVEGGRGILLIGMPQPAAGDANLDGMVDDDDLSLLLANWSGAAVTGPGWRRGDFDGDLAAGDNDLSLLLSNWTPSHAPVAEPLVITMLGASALAPLCRRSRKGRLR